MARLPVVGSDSGQWGDILNEFLQVSHRADGSLKNALEVVNVKDFGAVGDGVTDDTSAVQAAIDFIENTGGMIYFPPGTYNFIQSRLEYSSNKAVIFAGAGWESKLVFTEATDSPAQNKGRLNIHGTGDDAANWCISASIINLYFDFGGSRAAGWAEDKRGINIYNVEDSYVLNCFVKGSRGEAIGIGNFNTLGLNNDRCLVQGNYIYDFAQNGVNPNVHYAKIIGNHLKQGSAGFEIGSSECVISDNVLEDMIGSNLCGSVMFQITGNLFRDCGTINTGSISSSIYILGGGANSSPSNGIIRDNIIINSTNHAQLAGISTTRGTATADCANIEISGNVINGAKHGIYIQSLLDSNIGNNLIVANTDITNYKSGAAIELAPVDGISNDIQRNIIANNRCIGIFNDSPPYENGMLISKNNRFIDNIVDNYFLNPQWHNVIHYGARGDGITNDTLAIQAAIDAAESLKGEVYVPAGTYNFTTLNMKKNTRMRGAGMGASILNCTNTGTGITFSDIGGVEWQSSISDIKINTAVGTHAVELVGVANVQFDRVWIRGWSASGIHFRGTATNPVVSISIHECQVEENLDNILVDGTSNGTNNHVSITNCRLRASLANGHQIKTTVNVRNWHLSGNDLESGPATALLFQSVYGLVISGNYFEQGGSTPCIEIGQGDGISIIGNDIGGGSIAYSAIKLGTIAMLTGISIIGNNVSLPTNSKFVDPIAVNGILVSGNKIPAAGTITMIGAPGPASASIYSRFETTSATPFTINTSEIADNNPGNYILLMDASSGSKIFNLPPPVSNKGRILIIKQNSSNISNTITIDPNGVELIDGSPILAFSGAWVSKTLLCDGTNWITLN